MGDDTTVRWHLAPVKIPAEVKAAIVAYCRENRLSLSEFVLHACMHRVGYTSASIQAARAQCYGIRTHRPPKSMLSQPQESDT